jgi:hypothetical protein
MNTFVISQGMRIAATTLIVLLCASTAESSLRTKGRTSLEIVGDSVAGQPITVRVTTISWVPYSAARLLIRLTPGRDLPDSIGWETLWEGKVKPGDTLIFEKTLQAFPQGEFRINCVLQPRDKPWQRDTQTLFGLGQSLCLLTKEERVCMHTVPVPGWTDWSD